MFQKSVVQAVLDATHERPWLWAVIIVVVLLPIVLLIAYCCMPGSSKVTAHISLSPVSLKGVLYLTGLRVAVPHDTLLALVRHSRRAASNLRHQASDAGNGGCHAPPLRI